MFTNQTIDELLVKLDNPEMIYYDYIPAVPLAEALQHPADDFKFWTNLPNKPLRNLYTYMQQNSLEYLYEPAAEMVANALRHGNKYSICPAPNGDPMKSLSIKIFKGNNGILFRVRNEGTGFDYQQMLAQFAEGTTHSANILGGNGIRMLANPDLLVSYEDKGRITNLLYLFPK